jgi:hypothetical protein
MGRIMPPGDAPNPAGRPNSGSGQTNPDCQAARRVFLGAPLASFFLRPQPTAFSWAAGGPRAEPSSQSPQWRRTFSITSV